MRRRRSSLATNAKSAVVVRCALQILRSIRQKFKDTPYSFGTRRSAFVIVAVQNISMRKKPCAGRRRRKLRKTSLCFHRKKSENSNNCCNFQWNSSLHSLEAPDNLCTHG